MGTCNYQKPLSLTVDLTLIDSLHPILALSLPSSQTPIDLFRLIRNQLPVSAPVETFQFSMGVRIIRMTSKSFAVLRVPNEARLVLEFVEGKELTQVSVHIEGGQERFSLWVDRRSTSQSLLTEVSRRVRLPYQSLTLVQNSKELEDSDTLDPVTGSVALSVRLADETISLTRAGLELILTCDDPSCSAYLQRKSLHLGFGKFEYPKVMRERYVQCGVCGKAMERAELLQFRESEVRFEGLREDGVEEQGSERFSCVCGELLQGRRLPWRRLLLEVSSLPNH